MQALSTPSDSASLLEQGYGGHTMVAPLKRVIVLRPAAVASGDESRALGYLHPVDQLKSEEQHTYFRGVIASQGIEVIEAGPDIPGELTRSFPSIQRS